MVSNREIISLLDKGYVLVTSTQGLAQHLNDRYALQQIEQGKNSWVTPIILSWSAWCKSLWQELLLQIDDVPYLLNQHQSLTLWQELIQASRYEKQLLQIQATAKQAQTAYQLCKSWQLNKLPEDLYLNQDAFAFKNWFESYELRLRSKSWLDESALPDYLMANTHIFNKDERGIAFYGFDDFKPQQSALIESLKQASREVYISQVERLNESHSVVGVQDERAEVKALADWIIHCHKKNEKAQIGVIVPNLKHKREMLIHELEKLLCVEKLLQSKEEVQLPFTVSIGKPLMDYPMVYIAFVFLQLNPYRILTSNLGLLLRSPFVKYYSKEASNRCLLDARLKKMGQVYVSFNYVKSMHEQLEESQQCPYFIESLNDFFKKQEAFSATQSLGHWSRDIQELLKSWSWPGERNLNSAEYQTLEAWQKLLEQFANLETVVRSCSYPQAVTHLRKLALNTSFQPQTAHVPIHVMSTAGASGMNFDFIWFMGLHDQAWPSQEQSNPFLPIKLQRELGITNSSPELRLKACQQLTENIVQSAKHVVLSFPNKEGDRELRPSPMLKPYQAGQRYSIPHNKDFYQVLFENQELEIFYDEQAPEIRKGDAVSGGASLFKDQADCPFRAVMKHRLYAESLNETEIGLAAADRGKLVHRALQLFWQKMKHSEQLRRASSAVLNSRIEEAVNKAITEESKRLPGIFSERFTELEQRRLCRLLSAWLEIESQRQAFTVVATEKGHHVLFSDITLHMRIDRIDELANGKQVIIDYKTGIATKSAWEGERPDEPQMPLYAITSENDIAALTFAKVRTGDLRFIGLSDENNLLPGIKSDDSMTWTERIDGWKQTLMQLADEYRTGKATIEPKPYACSRCDLHLICRIHERMDVLQEDSE